MTCHSVIGKLHSTDTDVYAVLCQANYFRKVCLPWALSEHFLMSKAVYSAHPHVLPLPPYVFLQYVHLSPRNWEVSWTGPRLLREVDYLPIRYRNPPWLPSRDLCSQQAVEACQNAKVIAVSATCAQHFLIVSKLNSAGEESELCNF